MQDEIKRNPFKKEDYGDAMRMTPNEKKISFLNRYFVFKKISHVNAEKVSMEMIDDTLTEQRAQKKLNVPSGLKPVHKKPKTQGQDGEKEGSRKKAKRLNKKIVLLAATEAIDSTPDIIEEEKVEETKEEEEEEKKEEMKEEMKEEEKKPPKARKPRAKKLSGFVIEPDV